MSKKTYEKALQLLVKTMIYIQMVVVLCAKILDSFYISACKDVPSKMLKTM